MQTTLGGRMCYRPNRVMELLDIRPTKFWALVKSGALETKKIGTATVVTAETLERFVASLPSA